MKIQTAHTPPKVHLKKGWIWYPLENRYVFVGKAQQNAEISRRMDIINEKRYLS